MSLFAPLATLADRLAAEGSRLKKRAAITEAITALHQIAPGSDDPGLFALYLAGTPFPEADPRKLNAGGALLSRAVLTVSEATEAQLTAAYRRHGDLGAAAHDLLLPRPSIDPSLTLAELRAVFAEIAAAHTTATRAGLVEALLRRATPPEVKYLLKLMLGDMRIGVKQSLIEEAIAIAANVPVGDLRHAVMLEADLAHATHRAFAGTLSEARMNLFHPLGFMLASPVESPEEAVDRFTEKSPKPVTAKKRGKKADGQDTEQPAETIESAVGEAVPARPASPRIEALLEDKYDGMRAQVHCGDPNQPGRVALYSRNREDITASFPELAEAFVHVLPNLDGPMILDGEILAWDFANATDSEQTVAARALPFATLGQRIGRKQVSDKMRHRIPVVFMAFDLMVHHGELILDQPLTARRNHLETLVEQMVDRIVSPLAAPTAKKPQTELLLGSPTTTPKAKPLPRLILSDARLVESAADIDRAYADARARSNEGVMLKATNSAYQPGRRGLAWVKLKRELATLDVVITGAEFGSGRRAAYLSDYTFAVRGPHYAATGELLNVGKAYSGVTDLEITELTEFLKAHTLEDFGHFRTVEPLVILEVAFNNIMRSDRHAGGFALRFPRILRIRADKPLAEIDTVDAVEQIYLSQVDRPVE